MGKRRGIIDKLFGKEEEQLPVSKGDQPADTAREEKSVEDNSIVEQEQKTQEQLNKLNQTKPKLSYGEILRARQGERKAQVIAQRSKGDKAE